MTVKPKRYWKTVRYHPSLDELLRKMFLPRIERQVHEQRSYSKG